MADLICTPHLASFGYYAKAAANISDPSFLRLALLQNAGTGGDTALRQVGDWAAMKALAGVSECNFTGYTAGGIALAHSDITITTTSSTPFKISVTPSGAKTWNPAGGAVNNSPLRGVIIWQPDSFTSNQSLWLTLGFNTATGSASGGTFTFTPGTFAVQLP